jgi:hypothetical protein
MAISDFFSGGQTPDYLSGLLDDEQLRRLKQNAQQNALMQFGLSALAQGGYSQTPVGIGEILGKAGMAGMQGYQQGVQSGIEGIGTRAKLEELKRKRDQQSAYDVAAKDLYKTIPAQYETRQVAGGGYLPAQQEIMPGQVAPNFNLSQTMAAPTTEQVMTRQAVSGIDNAALLKMLQTGDPRATAMMGALANYKDYVTPAKEQLVAIPEGGSLYSPSTGGIVATGAPKVDKISFGAEAERKAAVFGKPFGQLPPDIQQRINKEIESESMAKSTASAPRLTNITKGEGKYEETLGTGLANRDLAIINTADTAPKQLQTAQSIKSLLKQNPIVGAGANQLQALNSVLTTAGLIDPSKQMTTELLGSDLASQTLANIKASGLGAGQGFTDNDRKFLERATAGQITMTAQSLLRLADLSERSANSAINKYNDFYDRLDTDKRKFYGLTPITISTPKVRFR